MWACSGHVAGLQLLVIVILNVNSMNEIAHTGYGSLENRLESWRMSYATASSYEGETYKIGGR